MLNTKFRENQPVLEKIFVRFLPYVTQMPRTQYSSPYPRRLHIKFGFDRPSGFGEEDL